MAKNPSLLFDFARKSSREPEAAPAEEIRFIRAVVYDAVPAPAISIEETCGQRVPGTTTFLRAYNILAGNTVMFPNRIAVVGAGRDFSPFSLKKRFQEAGVPQEFFTTEVELKDRAIVHASCFDEYKTLPATIVAHSGSQIRATLSLLSMDQQEVLTKDRPDCDLIMLEDFISLSYPEESPQIRALLHVNVWGALSDDHFNPLARIEDSALQTTNLEKISVSQATQRAYGWLGKRNLNPLSFPAFDTNRLLYNAIIQSWAGLAPQIPGTVIKYAPIREKAERLNIPISPV
jgi:hypothetical protein